MVHLLQRPVPLFPSGVAAADSMRLLRLRIPELAAKWFPGTRWQHRNRIKLFMEQVKDNELRGLLRGHGRSLLAMMKHILYGTALYDVRMKIYSMQDARLCPYMHGYSWWDGTAITKVIDAHV
jgi:hypothetical protein